MQKILLVLYFVLLISLSCSPLQTPNVTSGYKPALSHSETIQEQIRRKPSYKGTVNLKVDTSLLSAGKHGQKLDLTGYLNDSSFLVQSMSQEHIMFQQEITSTDTEQIQTWGFETNNLNNRYTLQIQKQGEGQVSLEVNLNGTEWVSNQHPSQLQYSFPNLLLYPKNSLRVKISGDSDVTVSFVIRDGVSVPYLNQRQGSLVQTDDSQSSRLQRNDVNYFNPALAESLKNLKPYQNHLGNVPVDITGVSVDGGATVLYESGTLVLQLNDPDTVIPQLQQRYGAKLIHEINIPEYPQLSTHYFSFDLEQSPILESVDLIKTYRNNIPAIFNDFVFASEEGLRTFVILLDILVHHPQWIRNWDLNLYSPDPAVLTPAVANDWDSPASRNPTSANNRGWWLRDTFAREAWNLSLGTGVRVAYIDRGFDKFLNGSGSHPEIERDRIILDNPFWAQNIPLVLFPSMVTAVPGNLLACLDLVKDFCTETPPTGSTTPTNIIRTHGVATIMSAFAQRNNGLGTAGVAPNAMVKPYNSTNTFVGYSTALAALFPDVMQGRIDVIGMNRQYYMDSNWRADGYISTMFALIDLLTTRFEVPIITAAHNHGYWFPENDPKLTYIPNVFHDLPSSDDPSKKITLIVAAGAERDSSKAVPSPSPNQRYNPNPSGEIRGWHHVGSSPRVGSNIVRNAIWAPASDVEFATINGGNDIARNAGTSYSCPIVTGAVALMKSRNPYLKPRQILDILRSSPTRLNITHDAPSLNNEPFLDIQHAVEQSILNIPPIPNPSPSNIPHYFPARNFPGYVERSGNQVSLRLNRHAKSQEPFHAKKRVLIKSVANSIWNNIHNGQFVSVQGWISDEGKVLYSGPRLLDISDMEVLDVAPASVAVLSEAGMALSGNTYDQKLIPASGTFKVKVRGSNILADLGSTSETLKLNFYEVGSNHLVTQVRMDFLQSEETLNNEGTEAVFVLDRNHDNLSALRSDRDYEIAVSGPSHLGLSNKVKFTVFVPGGFGTLSLLGAPSSEIIPQNQYAFEQIKLYGAPGWIQPNVRIPVEPNQFVGIRFNQPINDLKVQVGPIEVPVVSLLKDFAAIGIPEELPAGIHDVILRSTNGVVTLEQAVEKVAEALPPMPEKTPPPSSNPGEYKYVRLFNVEGNDEARVYVNGNLAGTAHAGDDISIEIGDQTTFPMHQDQRNEIRFELENRGGGYSYGFAIHANSSYSPAVFSEVKGVPGITSVRLANGEEDQRQGLVTSRTYNLYRYVKANQTSRNWARIFNTAGTLDFKLGKYNEVLTTYPDAQEHSFELPVYRIGQTQEHQYYYFTQPNGDPIATWGIEIYQGIHLIRRMIVGQKDYPTFTPDSPSEYETVVVEY